MSKKRDISSPVGSDAPYVAERVDSVSAALLAEVGARPLSARSLLLSYLLGTRPPEATAARLVDFGAMFDLRHGTVRTALSRMVANGEANLDDGVYRLAGRLLDRQRAQDEGQEAPVDDWDGTWWTAVATVDDDRTGTDRRYRRTSMAAARLAEVRPGVWMRPANVAGPVADHDLIVTRGVLSDGDPVELAARLWDLDAIDQTSAALDAALGVIDEVLGDRWGGLEHDARSVVLARTFEVSAVCVRHLRLEPRLPRAVAEAPATRSLRSTYLGVNRRFRLALDRHL